jgi:1,4-dihydroxy-2-naphthoate octaprenyltransferase
LIRIQVWLKAFRLRTLPLAFSSILLGGFLAMKQGYFQTSVLVFALVTTLFLQILSNLANDYGDYVKGTDNAHRIGPARTLQAGLISAKAMKMAIFIFSVLSFISGVLLLWRAEAFSEAKVFWFFMGVGLLCILCAITYTVGKNAYGYKGFGDVAVLVFFGLVGVLGTHYLMAKQFYYYNILPATACGLLATGVLNLNNLRDIENDRLHGKRSIPVMIGYEKGKIYHTLLTLLSTILFAIFILTTSKRWHDYLPLLCAPLYFFHLYKVQNTSQHKYLDKYLKQLALISLLTSLLFGISLI